MAVDVLRGRADVMITGRAQVAPTQVRLFKPGGSITADTPQSRLPYGNGRATQFPGRPSACAWDQPGAGFSRQPGRAGTQNQPQDTAGQNAESLARAARPSSSVALLPSWRLPALPGSRLLQVFGPLPPADHLRCIPTRGVGRRNPPIDLAAEDFPGVFAPRQLLAPGFKLLGW